VPVVVFTVIRGWPCWKLMVVISPIWVVPLWVISTVFPRVVRVWLVLFMLSRASIFSLLSWLIWRSENWASWARNSVLSTGSSGFWYWSWVRNIFRKSSTAIWLCCWIALLGSRVLPTASIIFVSLSLCFFLPRRVRVFFLVLEIVFVFLLSKILVLVGMSSFDRCFMLAIC